MSLEGSNFPICCPKDFKLYFKPIIYLCSRFLGIFWLSTKIVVIRDRIEGVDRHRGRQKYKEGTFSAPKAPKSYPFYGSGGFDIFFEKIQKIWLKWTKLQIYRHFGLNTRYLNFATMLEFSTLKSETLFQNFLRKNTQTQVNHPLFNPWS